jgi:hypothetical protein
MDIYDRVTAAMEAGDIKQLQVFACEIAGFPLGLDPFQNSPWLNHAAESCGYPFVFKWLIEQGCDVNHRR